MKRFLSKGICVEASSLSGVAVSGPHYAKPQISSMASARPCFNRALLTILFLCSMVILSHAQSSTSSATIGTTVNAKTTEAWQWANRIGLLMIMVVTMIGTIVTYGKKNSDQPGEFKRYVIGFGSGIAFLVVVLSLFNIIRTLYINAVGTAL